MVDQMDLQKSLAFYKDRFADASDFTFVFAGSFDVAAIKPLVERYLGSLPSLHRQETWKDVGIGAAQGRRREDGQEGHRAEEPGGHRLHRADRVRHAAPGRAPRARHRSRDRGCGRACARRWAAPTASQVDANASKIPERALHHHDRFRMRSRADRGTGQGAVPRDRDAQGEGADRQGGQRRAGGAAPATTRATWRRTDHLVAELAERYETRRTSSEFFDLPAEYKKLTPAARPGCGAQLSGHRQLRAGDAVPGEVAAGSGRPTEPAGGAEGAGLAKGGGGGRGVGEKRERGGREGGEGGGRGGGGQGGGGGGGARGEGGGGWK